MGKKEKEYEKVNKKNEEQQIIKWHKRISKKNDGIFYIKAFKGALYVINICIICLKYENIDIFITSLLITFISFGVNFIEKFRDKKYEESIFTKIGFVYPMMSILLLTILQIVGIIQLTKLSKEVWQIIAYVITISLYAFVFFDFGFMPYPNKKGAKKR